MKIPNYWKPEKAKIMKLIIKKKKLTKTQMKKLNLEYDGWGKKPNGKKEYYYVKVK